MILNSDEPSGRIGGSIPPVGYCLRATIYSLSVNKKNSQSEMAGYLL